MNQTPWAHSANAYARSAPRRPLGLIGWPRVLWKARSTSTSAGALALHDAVEANREQDSEETFVGILRTVSDGSDKLRVDRPDTGKPVRLSVDPEVGLTLGRLLGHMVRVEAAVRRVWHLNKGTEDRSYTLLNAEDLGTAPGSAT
jgi:hypothetical protein